MNILSILIFLPLLAGALILALPERFAQQVRPLALGTATANLALALWTWMQMAPQGAMQWVQKLDWVPQWGIAYHIGVDGISIFLVLLTTLFSLLAMIYALHNGPAHQVGRFYGLILVLSSGMLGTVLSLNLVLFYLFWELMLIPMYFLIGIWGGANRVKAVTHFVIYTMVGSLVLLFSMLYLAVQVEARTGTLSFDLAYLMSMMNQLPFDNSSWVRHGLFVGFALAFLIKMPIFPLHTWLPDTYVEAPAVVTFLLSGVMAKMGVYGLLRIALPLFPSSLEYLSTALSALAVIGIVYGAVLALGQTDIKRLIAYSSFSHMGLIALGLFSWNATALNGVTYHMMNHAVATGALFLLVGLIEKHYGTTEIKALGGLAAKMPVFATLFLLSSFASIGVPLLNGFVGEFMILLGVAAFSPLFTFLAALTLILSAGYMLNLIQRFLFGPLVLSQEAFTLKSTDWLALAPLCVLMILMGVYTTPFTTYISPAIQHTLTHYQAPLQVEAPSGASHG